MRELLVAGCAACAVLMAVPGTAGAQTTAAAEAAEHAEWGLLAEIAGTEWKAGTGVQRFIWAEPGKILAWQVKPAAGDWADHVVFVKGSAGISAAMINGRGGPVVVTPDAIDLRTANGAKSTMTITRVETGLKVSASGLVPVTHTMERIGEAPTVMDGATRARFDREHAGSNTAMATLVGTVASSRPAAAPTTPIILGQGGVKTAAPVNRPAAGGGPAAPIILAQADTKAPAPVNRPAATTTEPAPTPSSQAAGPIVLASAPPPPAPLREARKPAATAAAATGAAPPPPDSREAKMQAQVNVRRQEIARQQEAERQARLEAERQAEYARQEQRRREAERAQFWGQMASGGLMILQAAADAQAEVNAQHAELNRLRILAEEETRQKQERIAAEQRARENEHARRVAQAQIDQQQQNAARQQQSQEDAAARASREREEREAADRARLEREQRQKQEAEQAAAQAEQERKKREAEAKQREADARRAEEARKQLERRQMMMTGNASGSYAVVGLPPISPGSRGPGSGTMSVSLDHIGGCRASGAQVKYSLGVLMGEAVVNGGFSWQGEQGCTLPSSAEAWVKVSHGASYGWVSLDATPASANSGYGYNSAGSPPWSQLLCGFSGGQTSGCMDADSAKRLWTNGSVTEVRIGW